MVFENVKEIILPLNDHRNRQRNNGSCSNAFRVCSVCKSTMCGSGKTQDRRGDLGRHCCHFPTAT